MNATQLLTHFRRISEAPDAIPRLRRFILDLAVRGKLVEQDPDDEPAAELLKRIKIDKVRGIKEGSLKSQGERAGDVDDLPLFEIPQGWVLTTLGEVVHKITDGAHKTPTYVDKGVPFISVKDFSGGQLDFSRTRFISPEEHKALYKRCDPRRGDILIGRIGTLGKAVIVDTDAEFSLFVSVGLIRFSHEFLAPTFLRLLLNSPHVESEFNRIKVGGGTHTNKLNLGDLHTVVLPLPPLAEQRRIVAKVGELMALCDQLEAARAERESRRARLVAASLRRLSQPDDNDASIFGEHVRFHLRHLPRLTTCPEEIQQLRQAILNLAVRGQLVAQDLNDEPASELLKCIQKEKVRLIKAGELRQQQPLPPVDHKKIPFGIPASWCWIRMDDCFSVSGGIQKTPFRAPKYNPHPYIGVGNVYRGRLDLSDVKQFELLEGELEKFRLVNQDILVVEGNGSASEIGRCAVWSGEIEECVHQNHIIRCRPFEVAITPYVVKYLNSPKGVQVMKDLAVTSSGLYNLSVGKIRTVVVPLPPLGEQRRIVARVDELMTLCDHLEEQLSAVQAEGRRLLDAVLHKALAHKA